MALLDIVKDLREIGVQADKCRHIGLEQHECVHFVPRSLRSRIVLKFLRYFASRAALYFF
jgi:hypothetical protein